MNTATLILRIDLTLRGALRIGAELEHRTIAHMVEVQIRDDCIRRGIEVAPLIEVTDKNSGVRA